MQMAVSRNSSKFLEDEKNTERVISLEFVRCKISALFLALQRPDRYVYGVAQILRVDTNVTVNSKTGMFLPSS